jgi:hypothetical protein
VKSTRPPSKTLTLPPVNRKRASASQTTQLGRGSNRLVSAARSFAAKIVSFELTGQAAADLAGQWRLEIDAQERRVVEWFSPAKQAAFRAHAAICRQENEALAPCREARRVLNGKLAAWQDREHRSRPEGAAQLEAGPNAADPQSNLIADVSAVDAPPRVEGVSFRDNWRAEVVDKVAFVAAVAAKAELVNLIEPNTAALGHLARAHKSALSIPGVRVWCERIVAASRRL